MQGRLTFAQLSNVRRVRRGPLSLAVLPGPGAAGDDDPPPRVAYAIGKRVGPAVVRNRVRRRLRACVSSNRGMFRPGAAYLFGASPAAAGASYSELEGAVSQLLRETAPR